MKDLIYTSFYKYQARKYEVGIKKTRNKFSLNGRILSFRFIYLSSGRDYFVALCLLQACSEKVKIEGSLIDLL